MKSIGTFEKLTFTSYNDLKKHRNDEGLSIFAVSEGALFLMTPKELRDEDFDAPKGRDKSDYNLYYEHYYSEDSFEYRAIEEIDLDYIFALRQN